MDLDERVVRPLSPSRDLSFQAGSDATSLLPGPVEADVVNVITFGPWCFFVENVKAPSHRRHGPPTLSWHVAMPAFQEAKEGLSRLLRHA